jgi:predicted S18 family serine protease
MCYLHKLFSKLIPNSKKRYIIADEEKILSSYLTESSNGADLDSFNMWQDLEGDSEAITHQRELACRLTDIQDEVSSLKTEALEKRIEAVEAELDNVRTILANNPNLAYLAMIDVFLDQANTWTEYEEDRANVALYMMTSKPLHPDGHTETGDV